MISHIYSSYSILFKQQEIVAPLPTALQHYMKTDVPHPRPLALLQ